MAEQVAGQEEIDQTMMAMGQNSSSSVTFQSAVLPLEHRIQPRMDTDILQEETKLTEADFLFLFSLLPPIRNLLRPLRLLAADFAFALIREARVKGCAFRRDEILSVEAIAMRC